MEGERLLPCSATWRCLKSFDSSPHPHSLFFKIHFNIILPSLSIHLASSLQVFRLKFFCVFLIFQVGFFCVVTPCSIVVGYQFQPWRWRQRGPPKRWYPATTLRGAAEKAWNLAI